MPNFPIVNAGEKYVNGFGLSVPTTTTINVAPGQARDSTNVNDIVSSSPIVLDGTTQGANGLDTGTLAANTWYAVYLIGDSTQYQPTAALASLDFTSPEVPGEYDMFRRVGAVQTDGSSLFLAFEQYGAGVERTIVRNVGVQVLSAGAATTSTAIDLSAAVPPIRSYPTIIGIYSPASAPGVANFGPIFGSQAFQMAPGAVVTHRETMPVASTLQAGVPTMYYELVDGAVDVFVVAYTDSLD